MVSSSPHPIVVKESAAAIVPSPVVLNFSAERLFRAAGDYFLYEGDTDRALELINKTLACTPLDRPALLRALVLKADILFCQNDDHQALDVINEALALDDQFVEAYLSKASILESLGRYTQALQAAQYGYARVAPDKPYLLSPFFDLQLASLIALKRFASAEALLQTARQQLEPQEAEFLVMSYQTLITRGLQRRRVRASQALLTIHTLPPG